MKHDLSLALQPDTVYYEPLYRRSILGFNEASITQDESGYAHPVTVGEGEHVKTFFVQFDTGSSDFWLFSNLLGNQTLNFTHTFYGPFPLLQIRQSRRVKHSI